MKCEVKRKTKQNSWSLRARDRGEFSISRPTIEIWAGFLQRPALHLSNNRIWESDLSLMNCTGFFKSPKGHVTILTIILFLLTITYFHCGPQHKTSGQDACKLHGRKGLGVHMNHHGNDKQRWDNWLPRHDIHYIDFENELIIWSKLILMPKLP